MSKTNLRKLVKTFIIFRMEGNGYRMFWRRCADKAAKDKDKNIFEILTDNALNERLDRLLSSHTKSGCYYGRIAY